MRLKTAPAVPSPLRNVVNGASPPGSPPSGSPQMRTRAATVLTEIIEKVTPPPKPDIANPYQTASPVKPAAPKTRKRIAERRAKEKEKQAELEREKAKEKEELEKEEAMLSPKTIIEATVPKVISLNLRMCKSLTKVIRRVLNAAVLPQILANRLPKSAFLSRTSLVVLWKWKILGDSVLTMTIL